MVVVYKDRKTPRIANDELEKFTFQGAHPPLPPPPPGGAQSVLRSMNICHQLLYM